MSNPAKIRSLADDPTLEPAMALRLRAEEQCRELGEPEQLSPEATQMLLHELRVHQIELEMQNEELRRADEEREASRARFVDLYDFAPVGYLSISEPGLILEANLTAATLLGLPRGSLLRQPLTRFVVSEDQDVYYRHRRQIFKDGFAPACELRLLRTDGPPFWALLEAALAGDGEGEAFVYRVVLRDITARKLADEALRELTALNEALFLAIPFPMDIVDAQGKVLYLNEHMEEALGVPALGQPCWTLADPDMARLLREPIQVGSGGAYESPRPLGGKYYNVVHSGMVFQGREARAEIFVDITQRRSAEAGRKMLEQKLYQAQKLESLGSLAGGVALDMDHVLGGILNLATQSRDQGEPQSPASRNLDSIIASCRRGRSVVKSLLYFAHADLHEEGPVDVNGLISDLARLLSHTTLNRIQLDTVLDAQLGPLRGDAGALSHALMNLCLNAMDAMPDGGSLILSTAAAAGGGLEVRVMDTGEGMGPDVLAKAMDPFFTTKAPGKGTGLGLAMVYGAMQAHQGTFELRSAVGHGTEAILAFPPCRMALKEPAL